MRSGTTLPELLVALAVAGLLAALGVAPAARALDRLAAERAARRIAAAYAQARAAAVLGGSTTRLVVTADSLVVRRERDGRLLWRAPGPAVDGADLETGPREARFAGTGLGWGLPNATLRLRRGEAVRLVIVSRLGRVRLTSGAAP